MQPHLIAKIDAAALLHNLSLVRRALPAQPVLAMVKANAYGHGLVTVAEILASHVQALGVACLQEALQLRQAGIDTPLLVLQGVYTTEELQLAAQHNCSVVVHHLSQVALLAATRLVQPIKVWLKLDTGLSRLGLQQQELLLAYQQLAALPQVEIAVVMTHFAEADQADSQRTAQQYQYFGQLLQLLPAQPQQLSLANSAALLQYPAYAKGWLRPGLMLYGASPFAHLTAAQLGLRPVMTLQTRIIAIKQLASGAQIGYGGRYRCVQASWVAIIAIGYADGYAVTCPDGTPVLVRGQRCPLVGRVSMDMAAVDISSVVQQGVSVGELVTLWGNDLPVAEIAAASGQLSYSLLTGVGPRVARLVSGTSVHS
jgi:alanine racemase